MGLEARAGVHRHVARRRGVGRGCFLRRAALEHAWVLTRIVASAQVHAHSLVQGCCVYRWSEGILDWSMVRGGGLSSHLVVECMAHVLIHWVRILLVLLLWNILLLRSVVLTMLLICDKVSLLLLVELLVLLLSRLVWPVVVLVRHLTKY